MPAKLTAVLGACKRQGRWKVSSQTNALVLFGHCYIDYREAYADDDLEKMKLKVTCLLGNATFIVPEGSDIQPSVVSLLAATGFDVPEVDVEPPLPTLVIETTTVLGRCKILTTPPSEAREEAESAVEQDVPSDGLGGGIGRVDEIGGGAAQSAPEVELPPLEAVAKALLAEPANRAGAIADEASTPREEPGIGLMPSRDGKDGAPLGIGMLPPRDGGDADAEPLGIGLMPSRDGGDADAEPLGIGLMPSRDGGDADAEPLGIGLGQSEESAPAEEPDVQDPTSDAA